MNKELLKIKSVEYDDEGMISMGGLVCVECRAGVIEGYNFSKFPVMTTPCTECGKVFPARMSMEDFLKKV